MTDLQTTLAAIQNKMDVVLAELLPTPATNPSGRLFMAARYSALAPGKRLRPLLVVEFYRTLTQQEPTPGVWRLAAALECIHCFALIHDDLPCMDNDDLRRGVPTCHKQFDEATALLAGDALLAWGLQLLNAPETHPDAKCRGQLVQLISQAALDMIAGQQWDVQAEVNSGTVTADELFQIQDLKTGAMFRACAVGAGVLARAGAETLLELEKFATHLGRVFQLTDDLLDVTASAAQMGKTAGKDAASAKATFVTVYGLEKTRTVAQREGVLAQQALYALNIQRPLNDLIPFILQRNK